MSSLTKVVVKGTLAENPIVQLMRDHRKMVGLNVYTESRWYDDEAGHIQQKKEWHRVVITDQQVATYAERQLSKDDEVYLEGELHTADWQDAKSAVRSITYIKVHRWNDRLRCITDDLGSEEVKVSNACLPWSEPFFSQPSNAMVVR